MSSPQASGRDDAQAEEPLLTAVPVWSEATARIIEEITQSVSEEGANPLAFSSSSSSSSSLTPSPPPSPSSSLPSMGPAGGEGHGGVAAAAEEPPEGASPTIVADRIDIGETLRGWMKNASHIVSIERVASAARRGAGAAARLQRASLDEPLSGEAVPSAGSSKSRSASEGPPLPVRSIASNEGRSGEALAFRDATDSICSFPDCVAALNITSNRFHCRKCNGWYCGLHAGHASLALKLDPRSGEPSAARGLWSRVCQRCFADRFYRSEAHLLGGGGGDDDHHQQVRLFLDALPIKDHRAHFEARRRAFSSVAIIEAARLEESLSRLLQFSVATPAGGAAHRGGKGRSAAGREKRVPLRIYEQMAISWQADEAASHCRVCARPFTLISRRKHHCRICGFVICGDASCSRFFSLTDSPVPLAAEPSASGSFEGSAAVRCCMLCERILFRRRTIRRQLYDTNESDPVRPLVSEVGAVKGQIDAILPRFKEQLLRFESELDRLPPVERRILDARHEAMTARDTLMLLFRHLDATGKTIRRHSLAMGGEGHQPPTGGVDGGTVGSVNGSAASGGTGSPVHHQGPTARRIYANIHRSITIYLQGNMFTLQVLPRLDMKRLKRSSPRLLPDGDGDACRQESPNTPSKEGRGRASEALSFLPRLLASSFGGDGGTAHPEILPANHGALTGRLAGLEEQRASLESFLEEAYKAHQLDSVRALRMSIDEVAAEIALTQAILRPKR